MGYVDSVAGLWHRPSLLAPVVAVTDSAGYDRLNNLPPGTFAISAELAGFSAHRREGIVMRAGLTFNVDIEVKVGALTETVTVSGESPMIETSKPTSIMNIDGDLLRAAPVTSRRLFSDVLDGANVLNGPNYLSRFNRHPPRAAQLSFRYKF